MISPLELVTRYRVVVCAGPGGVGKTTVAASLATLSARNRRRTLAATVDPAPRLLDALGLPDLAADARPISAATAAALGIEQADWLSAARIDAGATFATLVGERVSDPAVRARIVANSIYQQITSNLTATQEYAANLALCDLAADHTRDLLVLDTPPSANALEFFDAPARLTGAIESPLVGWLLGARKSGTAADGGKPGFFSFGKLGLGGAVVLKRLGRLVGSHFLDDLGEFLADFQPVLGGFIEKSARVTALLRAPDVAVVLVCTAEPAAIDETVLFGQALRERGLTVRAVLVNRILPDAGAVDEARIAQAFATGGQGADEPAEVDRAAHTIASAARLLHHAYAAQRAQLTRLAGAFPALPIFLLPLHDLGAAPLDSLARATDALTAHR